MNVTPAACHQVALVSRINEHLGAKSQAGGGGEVGESLITFRDGNQLLIEVNGDLDLREHFREHGFRHTRVEIPSVLRPNRAVPVGVGEAKEINARKISFSNFRRNLVMKQAQYPSASTLKKSPATSADTAKNAQS